MTHLGNLARQVDDLTAGIEDVALSVVSRLAPVAAAIPNAVMVARATSAIFDIELDLSYVIAGAMECIGQSVTALWMRGKSWNAGKRKTDQPAPVRRALALMVAYFALDVGIVVALAIPNWLASGDIRQLFAVAYPLVGIVSTIVLNERIAQFRRETEAQKAALERRKARQERQKQRRAKPKQLESSFICKLCGYVAKSQLALNGHMKAHRDNGRKIEETVTANSAVGLGEAAESV